MAQDDTSTGSNPLPGSHTQPAPTPQIDVGSIYGGSIYGVQGQALALSGVVLKDLDDEPPAPDPKLGLSKYQIREQLGAGGMGVVYLAYDQDLKRHVALKVVKALERDLAQRFVVEAQVMAQLQHPYIVPVFEVGLADDQRPYYTMPVVRGRSLRDVLADLRAGESEAVREYSLARRLQIFVQVCRAVGYAHAKGVVHRDLKPGNVMLGRYGEVQVMDWGLSKVLEGVDADRRPGAAPSTGATLSQSASPADRSTPDQQPSEPLVGTPGYMAPEQIEGAGSDHRTDIYALGSILYELLTLTWPFTGTISEVLTRHLTVAPEPPSRRAPDREVPRDVEAVCLTALNKHRDDRHASVEVMRSTVQQWLEAESDRARRHELAEVKAAEGQTLLQRYRQSRRDLARLEEEVQSVAERFESWQPAEEKVDLFVAEDRVREVERTLARLASTTVNVLGDALAFEETNATARELLAEYYWERFTQAEDERDEHDIDFFGELVRRYHGGKYSRELQGDGSLTIDLHTAAAEPDPVTIRMFDLVEHGPTLVAENERKLDSVVGTTMPLAMGSYLLAIERPRCRPVHYPVYIARCKDWSGTVRLFNDEEIGDGFVHIPAGSFIQGGDPLPHRSLPRSEPWVDDFFIAIQPVTVAEYLEYLAAVTAREGLDSSRRRAPRASPDAPTYLNETADGQFTLPPPGKAGIQWHPRLPVVGISWHDAVAYCAWRSERDRRPYRLPSETEWEKSARGVDGRLFPWGDRFDPSLCNMRESRREGPALVPIDDFPRDVTLYGVRGMGGNVQDWTSTAMVEGTAKRLGRVARGGAWLYSRTNPRVACRSVYTPASVLEMVGFRLAAEPPTR